jgi:putative colanic acid biosysnthesis UDP-glucose lipid carrier transferase
MESRYLFILIFILSVVDAIAVTISCLLAFYFQSNGVWDFGINFYFLASLNVLWFLSAIVNRLYKYKSIQSTEKIFYKSALTFSCQVLAIGVCQAYFNPAKVSFNIVFYSLLIEVVGIALIRVAMIVTDKYYKALKSYKKTIAIFGYNEVAEKLAKYFRHNKRSFNFIGHFKDMDNLHQHEVNHSGHGQLEEVIRYAIEHNLDEVYSTLPSAENARLVKALELAEQHCVKIRYIATFSERQKHAGFKYSLTDQYSGIPMLLNRPEPLNELHNRIAKRLFDIVFSLFVIVFVLWWVIPILALLIKLDSPGSVFFMQLRSGRDNKPFWCYKLRSMHVNEISHEQQAARNDMRITKIGAFMRKTSLDELPQFFNVLIGNMSIVGPRPHMLKHTDEYRGIIEQYMIRLYLKPGITGWAQVNGHRGETKDHEQMRTRVEYDIFYLENWSIREDIKIIFLTIYNTITGEENAY